MLANAVSVLKAVFAVLAAVAAYRGQGGEYALYLLAIVLEMVDGPVARYMGTSSEDGNKVDVVTGLFITASGVICLLASHHLGWIPFIAMVVLFIFMALGVNLWWHKTQTTDYANAAANNFNRVFFISVMMYVSFRYAQLEQINILIWVVTWLLIGILYYFRDTSRAHALWCGKANH